ncbi:MULTISPECIES: hypothetical protein [Streptomyces]|uniref:Uncharacterized protein n=2 Tax=Streptomyces bottropensis TaxID=42235 RepID=M3DL23_9ACTN|nr:MULTISPECIES: hypothetical protein [Streptomyces]EMF57602.1 hypothetical protein SBD_0274 [Streptomyces bottropensis ATCC 25435]MZD18136.1 hypothetical protein [Streptomyces sp. SID5476]
MARSRTRSDTVSDGAVMWRRRPPDVRTVWARAARRSPRRVHRLERFPELQPNEEGTTDVADTYAFFGVLCLRYALLAHGSGNADEAASCGHAALTAMGLLDRNVSSADLLAEEQRLQSLSLSGDASGLWDASVTAGRERLRVVLGRLPR